MTRPRVEQICLDDTPWYHIVNRCVRRAFLCGVDSVTKQSYEHRRAWIEQRIMQLASVFAIDVASYAIMSNHYHLVLRVNVQKAESWSNLEVLQNWTKLFSGSLILQKYLEAPDQASESVIVAVNELADLYRKRLYDISWMMRVLNESIARMANREDGVKGCFWEGRFKSQALLDEKAVLSVMAYVDLNPIRASMASDLVSSDYTSIKRRVERRERFNEPLLAVPENGVNKSAFTADSAGEVQSVALFLERLNGLPMASLMAMDGTGLQADQVPFDREDYIEFVTYLGRAVHPRKQGFIESVAPRIMARFGLTPAFVKAACTGGLSNKFGKVIGAVESLAAFNAKNKQCYAKGATFSREIFT